MRVRIAQYCPYLKHPGILCPYSNTKINITWSNTGKIMLFMPLSNLLGHDMPISPERRY